MQAQSNYLTMGSKHKKMAKHNICAKSCSHGHTIVYNHDRAMFACLHFSQRTRMAVKLGAVAMSVQPLCPN